MNIKDSAKMTDKERQENFKRVFEKRVSRILFLIDSLETINNTSFYLSTEEERAKIINALKDSVKNLETKLKKGRKTKANFNL